MVGHLPIPLEPGAESSSCLMRPGEIAWSPDADALAIVRSGEPVAVAPPGVVRLGELTGGLEALAGSTSSVTIRRA